MLSQYQVYFAYELSKYFNMRTRFVGAFFSQKNISFETIIQYQTIPFLLPDVE